PLSPPPPDVFGGSPAASGPMPPPLPVDGVCGPPLLLPPWVLPLLPLDPSPLEPDVECPESFPPASEEEEPPPLEDCLHVPMPVGVAVPVWPSGQPLPPVCLHPALQVWLAVSQTRALVTPPQSRSAAQPHALFARHALPVPLAVQADLLVAVHW